jgi:hypothetical protein
VNRPPFAERAYAALVRLYPRQFRQAFRTDMVRLFREQCRDETRLRVYLRTTVDLIVTIPHQHMEAHMNRNPTPALLLTYLTVALVGVVVAVVAGSTAPGLIVGAALAATGSALAITTWRRAAPVRDAGLSHDWWKFLLAGPALIGCVIIAAGFGVEAWFLGIAVIVTALGLFALGLVLAAVHLAGRHHPTPT